MTHVLMIKAGETATPIRLASGDYDRWFLQTAAVPGVKFQIVQAHLGERLPSSPEGFDAVLVTGSPLSATQPVPWMLAAAEFMRTAAAQEIPVLGVCFGHQLLSLAHGGQVIRNPRGREIGTVEVTLTPEGQRDYLFEGLPPTLSVQATHEDEVPSLPEGATLLATNPLSPIQAMAIGPHLRGVQFHPELGADAMRSVILARAEKLEAEARARNHPPGEKVPQLLAALRPTPFGARVLNNFLAHAARRRG